MQARQKVPKGPLDVLNRLGCWPDVEVSVSCALEHFLRERQEVGAILREINQGTWVEKERMPTIFSPSGCQEFCCPMDTRPLGFGFGLLFLPLLFQKRSVGSFRRFRGGDEGRSECRKVKRWMG